jgi:hypothetical protein
MLAALQKKGAIQVCKSAQGQIISVVDWAKKQGVLNEFESEKELEKGVKNDPKKRHHDGTGATLDRHQINFVDNNLTIQNDEEIGNQNFDETSKRHQGGTKVSAIRGLNGEENKNKKNTGELKAENSLSANSLPEENLESKETGNQQSRESTRGEDLRRKEKISESKLSLVRSPDEFTVSGSSKKEIGFQEPTPQSSSAPPSRGKTSVGKKAQGNVELSQLVAAYVKGYQKRYQGVRPDVGGKVRGEMARYLADIPVERACQLIETYCEMVDEFFDKRKHDFTTFACQQNKVLVAHAAKKSSAVSTERVDEERVARAVDEKARRDASVAEGNRRIAMFDARFTTPELQQEAIEKFRNPGTTGKAAYYTAVYNFSNSENQVAAS